MIDTNDLDRLLDSGTVVAEDGSKIGKVSQIFLDDDTSRPEWVTVATGLFGNAESFVPLQGATSSGDEIRVPYSKDKVKDAPRISDSDGHLERSEEDELYRYYGLSEQGAGYEEGTAGYEAGTAGLGTTGTTTGTTGTTTGTDRTVGTGDAEGTVGRDTSGPTTDDAMTRSEERLDIGTERRSAGKARLRKYVVTENVTQTVPVSREEVRVEREPITEENRDRALSGDDLSSEEHEVELTEERVVVSKETVPVERVRLDKETVTEEQRVDEEVRKEQIEADTGTAAGRDEGDVRR
jgi:uncharacterized protein (TIGR02271 family)